MPTDPSDDPQVLYTETVSGIPPLDDDSLLWPGNRPSGVRTDERDSEPEPSPQRLSRAWRYTPWSSIRGLPPELLAKIAQRLRGAVAVYVLGFVAAYVLGEIRIHVMDDVPHSLSAHLAGQIVLGACLALSAVVFLLTRRGLSPAALVHLGLVYEVVGSFGIGLGTQAGPFSGDTQVWGVSWICVWLVAYPFIVPAPVRKAAVASFLSAAMGPAALASWVALGHVAPPPWSTVVAVTLPNFLCAALATFGSGILYRMSVDLGQARRMGSYRLVERLGRGGMGEVWLARHDLLARPAAIKLIRPDASTDEEVFRRFEREAQATAALQSPNTVRLFDFGITARGTFYYVMELLDGLDLDTLVRRHGPVPPERAVHLLRQACRSLAEAHHRGLIHRDVKPANLYACRVGLDYDVVKVLDFGLVRTPETRDAVPLAYILGTPGYMAPEVVLGKVPDARTDLYALGCAGYWLLTGRHPFVGEDPLDVMQRHVDEEPEPPSARAPQPVPPELDLILLTCLEKEPADRPPSAEELELQLSKIPFASPWTPELARAWWREHVAAGE